MENTERHRLVDRDRPHEARAVERGEQGDEAAVRMPDEVHGLAHAIEQRLDAQQIEAEVELFVPRPRAALAIADEVREDDAVPRRELFGEAAPLPRRHA